MVFKAAKLKRWKVGMLEQNYGERDGGDDQQQTSMQGKILTEEAKPILFSEWARQYLEIETVKRSSLIQGSISTSETSACLHSLAGKIITEIKPKGCRGISSAESWEEWTAGKSTDQSTTDQRSPEHCLNIA